MVFFFFLNFSFPQMSSTNVADVPGINDRWKTRTGLLEQYQHRGTKTFLLQVSRCAARKSRCYVYRYIGIRLSSFPFPPRTFKRTVGQDPFVRAGVCGNTGQVSGSRSSTVCRCNSFVVTTMTSRTGKRHSPNRQRSSGIIAPCAYDRWWIKKRREMSRRHLNDTMHCV